MRIIGIAILFAVGLASFRMVSTTGNMQELTLPSDSIDIKKSTSLAPLNQRMAWPYFIHLDSLYSSVPLFFEKDGHHYFYVVNGEWNRYRLEDSAHQYLMGIVDENYDTILPPIYQKLFSPDGIADGYIEFKLDGKKGLLNYRTSQLTPATFDAIFPSETLGIVAVGKRGNEYFNILPNCTEQLIAQQALFPSYLNILKIHEYNIKNETVLQYVNKQPSSNSDGKGPQFYYSFEGGVVIPPSYLVETGFVYSWIEGVGEVNSNRPFSTREANNDIKNTIKTRWGLSLLISDFYRKGISSRNGSFEHTVTSVAAIDTSNRVTGTALFYYTSASSKHLQANNYRFINDSLIEIGYTNCSALQWLKDAIPYDCITTYKYLEIKPNGELVPSSENRLFPSTKYVPLDKTYFKGSYVFFKYRSHKEINWPDDDEILYYVTDHLTANDLDLMYNEILADYGYKFKEAKWDTFFRQQEWYVPRFDNVDNQLNPIEKANMEVIKAMRDKIAQNPQNYIHGEFKSHK